VYTFFAPYSPSYSFFPSPPHPLVAALPPGRTHSALLFSDFVEEKEKMKNLIILLEINLATQ
jgi:hypothetical protein